MPVRSGAEPLSVHFSSFGVNGRTQYDDLQTTVARRSAVRNNGRVHGDPEVARTEASMGQLRAYRKSSGPSAELSACAIRKGLDRVVLGPGGYG